MSPRSSYDVPPSTGDEDVDDYLLELHHRIFGIGSDLTGDLDSDNLAGEVAVPFSDDTDLIKGSDDETKIIRIEVDGLTTATTRILSAQDKNYTIADDADIPTSIAELTKDHDLLDGLTDDDHTQYYLADGTRAITGPFDLNSAITPAQITANEDDYAPTGHATASVFRLSSDASRNITGLQGGSNNRLVFLHNIDANNIVLKDEDVSSTAANRFALNSDITIQTDNIVVLQYDSTTGRWRGVGGGGGGGGDLLADGTVPLTANWDLGPFALTMAGLIIDTANGIDIGTGADVDVDLITVDDLTESPKFWWDTSLAAFAFDHDVLFGTLSGVDISAGRLGLGDYPPLANLWMFQDGGEAGMWAYSFGSSIGGGAFTFVSNRGTKASPTAIQNGQFMGTYIWRGHDGVANTSNAAFFTCNAEETFTASAHGTRIAFNTVPKGSTAIAERLRIDNVGNIGIGATSFGSSAQKVLAIANGTAPGSSPANMTQLYSEDVSASSELKVRDEAGNITTLSPHSADELDKLPDDDDHVIPWIYKSENPYIGKKVVVDMEKVVKVLERLSGKTLATITDIPTIDWDTNQETTRIARENERTMAQNQLNELDALIATERDPAKKLSLETDKSLIQVPDSYTKKPPPKWMKDRGVNTIIPTP